MASLYEIAGDINQLLMRAVESDDGEVDMPPELTNQLDGLESQFDDKCAAICKFRQSVLSDAAAYKAEADRLNLLHERAERKADWLKNYLKTAMDQRGMDKVKAMPFSLSICKNSRPSIKCQEGKIPIEFQRIKVEFDGTKAYERWKEGMALPDEIVVEQGFHLRIR